VISFYLCMGPGNMRLSDTPGSVYSFLICQRGGAVPELDKKTAA